MTAAQTPEQPPPKKPQPRRRWWWRWTRRLVIVGLVCSPLAVVALFATRAGVRWIGSNVRTAEMAKLDNAEPGWRLPEHLESQDKVAPPAEQNSAPVVQHAHESIPPQWNEWLKRPRPEPEELVPLNQQQHLEDLTGGDELFAATRSARATARTLRHMPRGYTAHTVPKIPLLLLLPELDGVRTVTHLLRVDALVGAQEDDQIRAWRSARAMLNCGRSVHDGWGIICSLVRMASGTRTAETAMRLLALGEPRVALSELTALQAALLAEADEPLFHNGLRGELALYNQFFEDLCSGELTADDLAELIHERSSVLDEAMFYLRRGLFPGDHARYLKYMRGFLAAARCPEHQQQEALARVEASIRADRGEFPLFTFSQLTAPACRVVGGASLRHRAELRSAAVLIACERFRLASGRWPESLAELPKDLLPTVPLDPYDGTPLKFAQLVDGVAVYTVGTGSETDRDKKRLTNPLGGTEIGWRLYDPKQRKLPPLPKEIPEGVLGPAGPP